MSRSIWLTPEEMVVRRRRKRNFLTVACIVGTVIFSALVTILANTI